jgi:hypothetical protein
MPPKLIIKTSWLTDRFDGLFADEDIEENVLLCEYSGTLLTTREALKLEDKTYLMRLGKQCYVDAKDSPDCLARFINDCRNQLYYNAQFQKFPEQQLAKVISLRRIQKGEEIFANYGSLYWAGFKLKCGSPIRLSLEQFRRFYALKSKEVVEAID